MNSKIKVRRADTADKTTLCALGLKTFHETFDEFNTPEDMEDYVSKAFADEQLGKELQEKDTAFFIVEDGDRAVAYIKLRKGQEEEALKAERALEIHRIYVAKEYFGQGIGNVLLQTGIEYAKQSGYTVIWLGVWEDNARAIAFYKKNGFEKFSAHTFVLGSDGQTDWLMKKNI